MLFIITATEFQEYFLNDESDDDILNSQYVIVSNRIRLKNRSENENCISASFLFPSHITLAGADDDTIRSLYENQLNESLGFLSTLVKYSLKGENIFFICTKKENKIGFLSMLADYIERNFKYPVYNYKFYIYNIEKERSYNKNKVKKLCKELLLSSRLKKLEDYSSLEAFGEKDYSKASRERKKEIYKSFSNKEIKKLLKENDLYVKGMTKHEMIDCLDTFVT